MAREKIGVVGVDSGQLMVCDPCYVNDDWKRELPEGWKPPEDCDNQPFSYEGACNLSCGKKRGGQMIFKRGNAGAGVAVSTGFGDGTYSVYLERDKYGVPKRLIVNLQ